MSNFWESSVWGFLSIFSMLLISLLLANAIKKTVKLLEKSLIPTSVLAGTILLVVASVYKWISGDSMWDTQFFSGHGTAYLEMITYHTLALGFIAATLKTTKSHLDKRRVKEIFNTGVTTVSAYLLQALFGLAITIPVGYFISEFFKASGMILAFGFGQGTGQAMNYGMIYESEGFGGGKSFGLTIAAIGFLVSSFGGVIHMNVLRRAGKLVKHSDLLEEIDMEEVQAPNDIPMQESVDKLTIQLALITLSYFVAYCMMNLLGTLLPGMKATVYGFNFLLGVLSATLVKLSLNLLKKRGIVKKDYANNFLLTRTSNFFYDIMVVAGIAAINIDLVKGYIGVIIALTFGGMMITYVYTRFVAKKLFTRYREEQFLMSYGMLTGTASTGMILLREIDPDFKSPAADNLVYQNFPAIAFGFPLMLLANWCPGNEIAVFIIMAVAFAFMNVLLFRSYLFKNRKIAEVLKNVRLLKPKKSKHESDTHSDGVN